MTYQRKLGRYLRSELGNVYAEQWIKFRDQNGWGYAQPDFYLLGPHSTIVIECKLTERASAVTQIEQLYRPLLRMVYGLPVVGVQACKYLTPVSALCATTIDHVLDVLDTTEECVHLWHWLG